MRLRRVTGLVCAAIVAVLLVPAALPAESISELKARLDGIKQESAEAGRAFDKAYWALDETEVAIRRTDRRLATTKKRLAVAKLRLGRRVNAMYRRDEAGFIDFLVGAESFEDLVSRLDVIARVGAADAQAVIDVKRLRVRLYTERTRLRSEQKRRSSDLDRLRARRDKLQERLRANEQDYKLVKAKLDAARSGGSLPSGIMSVPGPNGMVFPVVGSYYYSDTWGASRGGGRRRHKGTDIMAPTGTPCVAVLPGTISSKEGGLGGKVIWLHADNGWDFYYAHLDSWVVRSGHVKAGQVIGTVGATGNAAGGAPHLHFQIHPGGGEPVNPYPYLRAME